MHARITSRAVRRCQALGGFAGSHATRPGGDARVAKSGRIKPGKVLGPGRASYSGGRKRSLEKLAEAYSGEDVWLENGSVGASLTRKGRRNSPNKREESREETYHRRDGREGTGWDRCSSPKGQFGGGFTRSRVRRRLGSPRQLSVPRLEPGESGNGRLGGSWLGQVAMKAGEEAWPGVGEPGEAAGRPGEMELARSQGRARAGSRRTFAGSTSCSGGAWEEPGTDEDGRETGRESFLEIVGAFRRPGGRVEIRRRGEELRLLPSSLLPPNLLLPLGRGPSR